jgi:catechol 2,3-dioxygenase-like lactoylglutathione lyase family enzyme
MIDHIGLRTRQPDAMITFYDKALAPLGYGKLVSYEDAAGFGRDGTPSIWIGASTGTPSSVHLAIASPERAMVDAFYAAAMRAGAKDNGAPGVRPDYAPTYYAAFVIDPDGNNLEAVCHQA